MNIDQRLTGPPSVCAQHQCIMHKSSKSAPQAPSSLKTEWKKNVLGLLLWCLYSVLSLGQGSPFPPFSEYQGIVTFKWNVLLDLSDGAVTKTLSSLDAELLL